MSSGLVTEPQTRGKVILITSIGELEIELWSKEAPKACRNFVQLCIEGYYNNCIFHRVIKDFIAQTGDKTGDGNNGESVFGEKFQDEFHSRLKFTRRGMLACAGSENKNDSQFFITLDKTESLNHKHTIFGKIVGDTIFNLLKVNDLEVDGNDRPVYPPKILKTEVIWNPFDDIVPRLVIQEKKEAPKANGVKNLSLLSFDGEEFESIPEIRVKSLHDTGEDGKLSNKPAVQLKHVPVKNSQEGSDLKSKIKTILNKKKDASVDVKSEETKQETPKLVDTRKIEEQVKESTHFGRDYLKQQKEKYQKGKRKMDPNEALTKIQNFAKNLDKTGEWKGTLKFSDEKSEEIDPYEVVDPLEEKSDKKRKYE